MNREKALGLAILGLQCYRDMMVDNNFDPHHVAEVERAMCAIQKEVFMIHTSEGKSYHTFEVFNFTDIFRDMEELREFLGDKARLKVTYDESKTVVTDKECVQWSFPTNGASGFACPGDTIIKVNSTTFKVVSTKSIIDKD